MSVTKKNHFSDEPMCKYDPETGTYIPLPLKWLIPTETKAENTMQSNTKRKITITPLKLSDLIESPNRAPKIRKTDSVRKGLFNLPPANRPTSSRRSIPRRSVNRTKKTQQKKNPCELSPLLDMEEVEEELLNKKAFFRQGYPFRTPSKPSIKFSKSTNCSPLTKNVKVDGKCTPKKDTIKTPESNSSNETEFLELETMCCLNDCDKENNQSPISSVCSLLEGTVLGSTKKRRSVKNHVTNLQKSINNIEIILKENEKAFNQFKASHEENVYKVVQILETDRADYQNLITVEETNRKKIEGILGELKSCFTNDKISNDENGVVHNRRSVRLLNKSPIRNSGTKKIVSPIVMKSGDLRKSTLTKNLVAKTQQYQIQSPRIQKALDMYNSMRGEISVLATPKLDRKLLMESPKSSNLSRLLSRRVQNQCLLLQDTPIHKK